MPRLQDLRQRSGPRGVAPSPIADRAGGSAAGSAPLVDEALQVRVEQVEGKERFLLHGQKCEGPVPVQMWQGKLGPSTYVAEASQIPAQMWQRRAQEYELVDGGRSAE